jgi:hypothetical protein
VGGTAVGRLRSGFSLRSRLDTAYRRAKSRVQRLTQGRVGLDVADDGEGAEWHGVAGISTIYSHCSMYVPSLSKNKNFCTENLTIYIMLFIIS